MDSHEKYMKRCIELGRNGLGTTYPNPLVGSVIVHNGTIIGEGWHRKAGEPHAEVNAVNSVKNKALLAEATIYVSLEPCSHFGKTPPCCDLILANGIPNIVVGTVDPNVQVDGSGIKKLREAGRHVIVGILENECRELNRRFFTFQQKKRPYVVLKWAESSDGFIAPAHKTEQKPVWISNTVSRQLAHKWRTEEQAILVGTQTVIDDNPQLNARDWSGTNPIRIVIDRSNRISKKSHIFDSQATTLVISEQQPQFEIENVHHETIAFDGNLAVHICEVLFRNGIQSVLIEGGRQTLQTFIDANLWDEARVFRGPTVLLEGTQAPQLRKMPSERKAVATDELLIFGNHD